MLSVRDFQARSVDGPVLKIDEFDLKIATKIRKLVKEYGIKYNPEQLIVDDETADKVYQAAVDFLVDVGVLNIDTERAITWSREEVEEVAHYYRTNPTARSFGRGEDEHTVAFRTGKDTRPPVAWVVAAGVIDEHWLIPLLQANAQDRAVQGFGIAGGVSAVRGIVPKAGTPTEIIVGLWEASAQIEALRRAGRPDMHLGLIPTVSTTGATAALLAQGLRGPHNTMIGIHIIPEQKLDWERLNLTTLCHEIGISPWTSAMSILGGLAGGPAGVAVCVLANFLAQLSLAKGRLGSIYVNDMTGRNSSRDALWTYSASLRAAERNIGVATGTCSGDSGPVFSKEENLIRSIAVAITLTASGGAYNWGAGQTPEEYKIHQEVMNNVAGMSPDRANELVCSLSTLLEQMDAAGGTPVAFNEMFFPTKYDVQTVTPKPEFLDQCKRVVDTISKQGVPISDKLVLG